MCNWSDKLNFEKIKLPIFKWAASLSVCWELEICRSAKCFKIFPFGLIWDYLNFFFGKILFLEYRDGFGLWGKVCIKAAAAAKNQSKKKTKHEEREEKIRKQKPWRISKICILLFLFSQNKEEKEESAKTA